MIIYSCLEHMTQYIFQLLGTLAFGYKRIDQDNRIILNSIRAHEIQPIEIITFLYLLTKCLISNALNRDFC